jgi:hypothetical protein
MVVALNTPQTRVDTEVMGVQRILSALAISAIRPRRGALRTSFLTIRVESAERAIGDAIKDYDDLWASLLPDIARQDFASAPAQVRISRGGDRLDAIRMQFTSLFERERAVIRTREESANRRSARAIDLGFGGLGLELVITIGLTMYLLRGQSRARRR